MKGKVSRLTIPTEQCYLAPTVAYILDVSRLAGFNEQAQHDIHLAVEETFTNIVKHGFGDSPLSLFEVLCEQSPQALQITFFAKGVPFDPARLPEYVPTSDATGDQLAGLGTFLVRQVMDEVRFENLGRDGYAIRLTKRLPQTIAHAMESGGWQQAENGFPEVSNRFDAEPCFVRPFNPEDAIEVSKCAFEAYGYSYEDYVYRPETLIRLNQSGLMRSHVAVTQANEIIGHCAIKRNTSEEKIAEVGVLFVRPKYRHGRYASTLTKSVISEARSMSLYGVYNRAVAGHLASQILSEKSGFKRSGILVGVFPTNVDFKVLTGTLQEKMSGVLNWLQLSEAQSRQVYIPKEYSIEIGKIYRELGLPVQIIEQPADEIELPVERSELRVTITKILDIAVIEVLREGTDLLQQIRVEWRRLCVAQISVIYLHLNLEQLRSLSVFSAIRELGFFFAGILPYGVHGNDAVILQCLNNLQIEYSQIKLLNDRDRELLSFIAGQDPIRRDLAGLREQT